MKKLRWLWWMLGIGTVVGVGAFAWSRRAQAQALPGGAVDWHHYKVVYADGTRVTQPSAELADLDQAKSIAYSAAHAIPASAQAVKLPVLVIDNQTGGVVYSYPQGGA